MYSGKIAVPPGGGGIRNERSITGVFKVRQGRKSFLISYHILDCKIITLFLLPSVDFFLEGYLSCLLFHKSSFFPLLLF
jgi:hypothetical protein